MNEEKWEHNPHPSQESSQSCTLPPGLIRIPASTFAMASLLPSPEKGGTVDDSIHVLVADTHPRNLSWAPAATDVPSESNRGRTKQRALQALARRLSAEKVCKALQRHCPGILDKAAFLWAILDS